LRERPAQARFDPSFRDRSGARSQSRMPVSQHCTLIRIKSMNSYPHTPEPRHAAGGFTLIETLVAVLVLSIGLLGIAALQLTSLQSNSTATQRSQATFLAYDIVDRMRANKRQAVAGAYNVTFASFRGGITPGFGPLGSQAQTDLAQLKAQMLEVLPVAPDGTEPALQVQQVGPVTDGVFEVSLEWNDTAGRETDGFGSSLVRFDLQAKVGP
jgi:type IV pilus assembly protein PilV